MCMHVSLLSGVPATPSESRESKKRVATLVLHHHGVGVDPSDSEAMRWFAKAAAQGHEGAQDKIATILAKRRASSSSSAALVLREDE